MADPVGVLGEIVARKRADIAARLDGFDPSRATPTTRGLRTALARPGARFVMEVKRASPSAGAIRAGADPAEIARAYRGAADAISVLTDGPYFGGSLEDLAMVRQIFDGPILAKDFVIDARQIAEARLHGADAVLVMLSVLGDEEARAMMAAAARLDMDALVEVHDEREARRALALGAMLIGVNNRDLRTLKVDLATTARLAPLIPKDRTLVCESGIGARADVERLAPMADAFLVGSALMRAASPAMAARALAFGRVKVCGLTSAEDAARAVGAGAAFAGIIFAPNTPRCVSLTDAEPIVEAARRDGVGVVGVFRNANVAMVAEQARAGLCAVQLHGEEDAAYIAALRRQLPDTVEIWAASAVGERAAPARAGADRTLFDTLADGRSGGSGRVFDWSLIAGRDDLEGGVLAGGLNPANAAAASRVGAYALDVGSGVEAAPRRKDGARLTAFFDALRAPSREGTLC